MADKAFKYWLLAFVGSSLLYLVIRSMGDLPFEWLPKSIPILLLMALAKSKLQGKSQTLMLAALTFSLAGDILLAFKGLFLPGLGAFLVAQVIYCILFSGQFKKSRNGFIWLAGILLYSVTMASFIIPNAGTLGWVVGIYLLAISCMAISAGFRNDPHFIWVALGAFIFMLSDSLIAVNKFVQPFPYAGVAIMVSYYVAQLMITLGIIRHHLLQQRLGQNPP
mgnify:CR=1 FL=1